MQAYLLESRALWIFLWPDLRNLTNRKAKHGKATFCGLISDLDFAFSELFRCRCSVLVNPQHRFWPWCGENLQASWTFTSVSCLWVSGSDAAWPWNDLSSEFFFQSMYLWTLVGTGPPCFAVPASKGGGRCNAEKQARLLLLLSTFNSAFTEYTLYRYREIINFFIYSFFFSLKLYSRKVYVQCREGSLEVQNPKEYLRYKYKYILNNNLYHALSMSESTVDRHVYMFLK